MGCLHDLLRQHLQRALTATVARLRGTLLLVALLALPFLAPATGAQIEPKLFVDSFVELDAGALAAIGAALPEVPNAGAAFMDPLLARGLVMDAPGNVTATFVWEGSGRRNALGYFTYSEDPVSIKDRQLIFPDASMPLMQPGETVTLRDADGFIRMFPAGTRIGFFLVTDGTAKSKAVKTWYAPEAVLPSAEPAVNADEALGVFTTLDAINPEQAVGRADISTHAAWLAMPDLLPGNDDVFLLGFEQSLRTEPRADNDFNDLIVLVSTGSANTDDVAEIDAGDPDGDDVAGTNDAYPTDFQRASVTRIPTKGFRLLLLDDGYPETGDGDFNDAVVAWSATVVTDSDGFVRDVFADFHLLARGKGDHSLGLHLPGLPSGTNGSVAIDRFLSDGTEIVEPTLSMSTLINAADRRIEGIIPSTVEALPDVPELTGVNVRGTVDRPAASSRVALTFSPALDPKILGDVPFDAYWTVATTEGPADVHQSGWAGFADRPPTLPTEIGAGAFLDDDGLAWMLEVPRAQRFPTDKQTIYSAFPRFLPWAASHGTQKPFWDAKVNKKAAPPPEAFLVNRPWTIGPFAP